MVFATGPISRLQFQSFTRHPAAIYRRDWKEGRLRIENLEASQQFARLFVNFLRD